MTSTDLNSMRWLGLFTNKIFRKHLKLIFPHRDFIICIVSLAIFQPHFVICILSSEYFHRHFINCNFPSAFYHPHFSIRHPPSAAIRSELYRDPVAYAVLNFLTAIFYLTKSCRFRKLKSLGMNHITRVLF